MTIEQIEQAYAQLCSQIGNIEVRIEGLKHDKVAIFKQIQALDTLATAKAKEAKEEKDVKQD